MSILLYLRKEIKAVYFYLDTFHIVSESEDVD